MRLKRFHCQSGIIGMGAVLLAAMLWSTTGTIQALLPPGRDPIVVAALRVVIAAAVLMAAWPVAARKGKKAGSKHLSLRSVMLFALAGFTIAAYNVAFFTGVSLAGVAVGTAVALGSGPLWVVLLTFIIDQKLPGPGLVLGQICAICGLGIIAAAGPQAQIAWQGVGLALLAGLSYTCFSMITFRLGRAAGSIQATSGTFLAAALLMMPVLLTRDLSWISMKAVPAILFLGVFSTALAYILFSFGIANIEPTNAVSLALAEPLMAWLLATFVVQERLTIAQFFGVGLLMVGLLIMTRAIQRRK